MTGLDLGAYFLKNGSKPKTMQATAPVVEYLTEEAVLLWAAGSRRELPRVTSINIERLVAVTAAHRMTGRLLRRIRHECPSWSSLVLVGVLLRQHAVAKEQMRRHLRVMHEIVSALDASSGALLPLKGFSTYALLADSSVIHYSDDLDLFAADLEQLWTTLERRGFAGTRRATHEFAKMTRDKVILDIHQYFPVFAYPPGVLTGAKCLELNTDFVSGCCTQQTLHFVETQVRHEDVMHEVMDAVAEDARGLTVLRPEILVVLLCAHALKHFTTRSHYFTPEMVVRVSEFADIYDLLRLPLFCVERFQRVVQQLGAQDAVHFAAHVFQEHFGFNPLPLPSSLYRYDEGFRFPEHLVLGGWAVLESAHEQLRPRDMTTMLIRMGATTVASTTSLDPQRYTLTGRGEGGYISHNVRHSSSTPFQIELAIVDQGSALLFMVDLPQAQENDTHHVLLHLGNEVSLAADVARGDSQQMVLRKVPEGSDIRLISDRGRQTLQLRCPQSAWEKHACNKDTIPALLAVQRKQERDAVVTSYFPLSIIRS